MYVNDRLVLYPVLDLSISLIPASTAKLIFSLTISIFKYTKTRSHPEVFRENNAKRPKPNGMSFRTALFRRRLLAAGVPENKSLPVRCFSGIETKVRESLPHFVSDSQTPPFIYWNTANYPEQQK